MLRKAIAITALAMIIAPAVHAKAGASVQVGTVGAEAGIRRGGVGKPPIQSSPYQGSYDPTDYGTFDPNSGYNNQNGGA